MYKDPGEIDFDVVEFRENLVSLLDGMNADQRDGAVKLISLVEKHLSHMGYKRMCRIMIDEKRRLRVKG
jgi:hypothetical protein